MANAGSSKWVDDFISTLQHQKSTQNTALQSYQNALQAGIDVPVSDMPSETGTLSANPLAFQERISPADYSNSPGFWSRAVDIVSRPLYASANLVNNLVLAAEGSDKAVEPWVAVGRGLAGKEKTTYSDVVGNLLPEDMDPNTAAAIKGIGGMAGDILLDPLNAGIPGAAKIFGKVRGATKVGKENAELAAARDAVEGQSTSEGIANKTEKKLTASAIPATPTTTVADNLITESSPTVFWPKLELEAGVSDNLPVRSTAYRAGDEVSAPAQEIYNGLLRDQIDDALSGVKVNRYSPVKPAMPTNPYEGMRTAAREIKTPALQKAFEAKYRPLLSQDDFTYIQKARYPKQWQDRVDEVINRMDEGNLSSVHEFVSRAKNGEIPQTEVKKVLDTAGVKGLDSLIPAYEKLGGTKFAPAKDVWGGTRPGVTVQSLNDTAKVAEAGAVLDAEQMAKVDAALKSGDEILADVAATAGPEAAETVTRLSEDGVTAKGTTPVNVITQGFRANKIKDSLVKEGTQAGLKGRQRDIWVASKLTDRIAAEEAKETSEGLLHKVTSAKTGAPQWTLKLSQILKAIGPEPARRALVSFDSFMMPSAVGAMAAKTLDLFSAAGDISREQAIRLIKEAGAAHKNPAANWGKYHGIRTPEKYDRSLEITAGQLWDARQQLAGDLRQNLANIALAKQVAAKKWVEQRELELVNSMDVANGGSTVDAINNLADVSEGINKIADEGTRIAAGEELADRVSSVATGADTRYAKTAKENVEDIKTSPPTEATKKIKNRRVKNMKEDIKEANDLLDSTSPGEAILPEDRIAVQIGYHALHTVNPIFSLAHSAFHAAGDIGKFFKDRTSGFFKFTGIYNKQLKDAMKPYSPEVRVQAWNALATGELPVNTEVLAAYNSMRPFADKLFDLSGKNPMLSAMFRDGYSLEDIQGVFREQGLHFDLTAEEAQKFLNKGKEAPKGKKPELTSAQERELAAQAWRNWSVEDPVEVLQKMHGAYLKLAYRSATADHAAALWGLRTVPSDGVVNGVKFTKLPAAVDEAETVVWKYMNKDLYYPEAFINQLSELESILKQSDSWIGQQGALASFVNNVVDPVLTPWKLLATVMRPGHLVRNIVSDVLLNVAAGVRGLSHYKHAMGALSAVGKLEKEVQESYVRTMLTDPLSGEVKANAAQSAILKGNKRIKFDDDQLGRMALQDGILPTYVQESDILVEAAATKKGLNKLTDKLLASRYMQMMGNANERSSWVTRLAQYNKLLTDPKFTKKFATMQEVRTAAAYEVKRFHPDTTGLSPEGRKYARRIMPFYSWTRQVIPTLLETMLTKPARITAVNKVIYNTNIASGGDPDSISNPWPDDLMVPDFIRDQMGYIGGGMAFNSGSPTESMADLFNGNVPRNFLSMLNPMIKAPIEIASGTDLGTGVPIRDKSEYIDKQLPGLSNFASISGVSPTGTLGNWLSGNMNVDNTRAYEQGRKTRFWNTSLANFIAGMSLQDFNNPTYNRIAASDIRTGGSL